MAAPSNLNEDVAASSDDDEDDEDSVSGTERPEEAFAVALASRPAATGAAEVAAACAAESPSGGVKLRLRRERSGSGGKSQEKGSALLMDGRFSDWPVTIGEKTYGLHAILLARASTFFESHINFVFGAESNGTAASLVRGSDLTDVIPEPCHAAFEEALEFIYSENQASFQTSQDKALLLLKIADILGISGLFDAMGQLIESSFAETAPLLLDQYCRFHIPGTDDGMALAQLREGAVSLIVRKFQPFLANPDTKKALLRLPAHILTEILASDDLLVACEDVVWSFVSARLSAAAEETGEDQPGMAETLCGCIRWVCVSTQTCREAIALGTRLNIHEVLVKALSERTSALDLTTLEFAASPNMPFFRGPRQPILPPRIPPPTSIEIDFCFHYGAATNFASGESLRSQPKKVGEFVLRVLVFPCGTDTGVAHGSLSVFLEAVPQPTWPRDWEFTNIRYALACLRWPSASGDTWQAKRKTDLWTFKSNRLDRGWHDFLSPEEVQHYLSPDGFVCLRGSLDPECLARCQGSSMGGYNGLAGEAAGSSGSRRSWAPPRLVGTGPSGTASPAVVSTSASS